MTIRNERPDTVEPTAITVAPIAGRLSSRDALRELERVVVEGDLSKLTVEERIAYYARVCESVGLNPLTRPFEYITLNNRLTLYARKDATDQLRDLHGVSVFSLERIPEPDEGLFTVIAYCRDRAGREDVGTGVVSIAGLKGEALANARMKAETKAKRRATLSICGLGWMDEVEAADAKRAEVMPRAEIASTIASRTAALLDDHAAMRGDSSGESEVGMGVLGADGAEAAEDVKTVPAAGSPESPPTKSRKRKAPAKQPSDEGYWRARAHAVGDERGLNPDAVKRIAGDVLGYEGTWSRKDMVEADWEAVTVALLEAPVRSDDAKATDAAAEAWAASAAVTSGVATDMADPWEALAERSQAMFGKAPVDLTTEELVEFGLRLIATADRP